MTVYALINKEVIPFVCSGKKVTIDYLHEKTKYPKDRLTKWLDVADSILPTIIQAKRLAKVLHIPFASLYMNTKDIDIKSIPNLKNYRTLDGRLSIDDSGLNIAICDVLQEREFLIEESRELDIPIKLFSAPYFTTNNPIDWAHTIRKFFSIESTVQYRCKSTRQLYLYLRERLESKGIFIQCFSGVSIDTVRGFSIFEQMLPVIGVNENDRPPAKSFSLIHELVHLLKRESSVCNNMLNTNPSQSEEVFCNAVAGELLVPRDALLLKIRKEGRQRPYSIDDIRMIAEYFSVSREVIIRRLLDCDRITHSEYELFAKEFISSIQKEREEIRIAKKEGRDIGYRRNVSREIFDKTSLIVSKTLFYGYTEGIYSKRDISSHLGIAQKHIDKYLMEVSKWNR